MKIVVLSDTHTDSLDNLPTKLIDEISGADLTIHAGDFTEKKLLDQLRQLGPLKGVYGNIDTMEVRQQLPAVDTVPVENFKIGVNHPAEGGSPFNMDQRLRPKFKDVDAIIHGHSHQTRNETKEGILYFNPGSATGTFPAKKKTYGILYIDKEIRGEIIKPS